MLIAGIVFMQFSSHRGEATEFMHKHAQGKTVVIAVSEVKEGKGDWNRVLGEVRFLSTMSGFKPSKARMLVFTEKNGRKLSPGDRLFIASEVQKIRNKGNPGEFDAEMFWGNKRTGLISFARSDQYAVSKGTGVGLFVRFTDAVRKYCIDQFVNHFGAQEAALLSAIVLGEKSLLDEETKNSFMNTGAMHVLAVSGLHIGLILFILLFIVERFSAFVSRRNALIVLVVFFWFYAFLTGASPSVIRAVFMFSMLAFSQLLSRRYDPVNILFFTAFVLLLIDPYTLFDIGFQLSYLAMLGIYLFYKPIEESVRISNKWIRKIWQGTAIGFAAQICTTPLSLIYFNQFPNYFILSNLGLMATSGLILGFGLFFPIVSGIPILSSVIAFCLSVIVLVTLKFLSWVEALPGAVVYGYDVTLLQLLLLVMGIVLIFDLVSVRYRMKLAGFFLIVGVGGMTYDRYERIDLSEVRIVNHNRPVILVKEGAAIFCFYSLRRKEDLPKISALAEAYSRVNPGSIRYVDITKKKWDLRSVSGEISIEDGKDALFIQVRGKNCLLRKSNDAVATKKKIDFSIGMPWVTANVDHCLSHGSVRVF